MSKCFLYYYIKLPSKVVNKITQYYEIEFAKFCQNDMHYQNRTALWSVLHSDIAKINYWSLLFLLLETFTQNSNGVQYYC